MTKKGNRQGGGYPRGRGKLLCYACGSPIALHPGLGPCPFYGEGVPTKKGMALVKKSENTKHE